MTTPLNDFLSFSLEHYTNWHEISGNIGTSIRYISDVPGVLTFMPNNTPSAHTKQIILSCGVHGNETAPIEICNALIKQIYNQEIDCKHKVMFIFGNLPAMKIAKRFVDENLNRLFDPNAENSCSHQQIDEAYSIEKVRAEELMQQVACFFTDAEGDRIHYDLHTAIRPSKNEKFAVYPYLHGKTYCKEQLQFMSDCGVNTILLSQSPTKTFSYFSSRKYGAHSFTVELGKVYPFGKNDMSKFTDMNLMLKQLIGMYEFSTSCFEDCPLEVFTVNQVINKTKDDFTLHFDDDLANFSSFQRGQLLASEQGKEFRAEYEDEAIVFPNANVALGQRALLTVVPHAL